MGMNRRAVRIKCGERVDELLRGQPGLEAAESRVSTQPAGLQILILAFDDRLQAWRRCWSYLDSMPTRRMTRGLEAARS